MASVGAGAYKLNPLAARLPISPRWAMAATLAIAKRDNSVDFLRCLLFGDPPAAGILNRNRRQCLLSQIVAVDVYILAG